MKDRHIMRAIELEPNLHLAISSDKLSVLARMTHAQLKQPLNPDRVLTVLGRHGIVLDAEQAQHVRAMCSIEHRIAEEGVVVFVQGVCPLRAVSATIVSVMEPQSQPGRPLMVRSGMTVARLQPGTPGKPGRDIYGATLTIPPASSSEPVIGPGCTLSGDTIVANADGSLHCAADRIEVVPVHIHEGRCDATQPPIDCAGDLLIVGDVGDGTRISATHSVHVEGMVENCEISAGADILIAGPIAASGKARLRAAGTVRAHRAQGVELSAGADVHVDQEVSHCIVRAGGAVEIGGRVIGSRISAVGGLRCQALGSVGAAKTIVEIGIDEPLREDYRRAMPIIEAQRKQVSKVRQTVEPLMRNVKQLTGPQKEKATELLCEADEIEHRTNQAIKLLTDRLSSLRARQKLEIEVRDQVHAGVIVRFPGVESTLRLAMKGPIRIACRREGTHTLVVGEPIEGKGASRPIEMRVTGEDRFDAIERMIHPHPEASARLSA